MNLINNVHCDDCLEIMKKIDTESIDCVITDCPYLIIAGGVRIVQLDNEISGVLNKRDYSITDPKGCLNRGRVVYESDGTNCSNKRIKKGCGTPSAVKDGKMFENNEIEFSDWLPDVFRILKNGTHCYIMINGRNLKDLQVEAEKVGFVYQNLLIRNKGNATPNKYYMQSAEFILFLRKGPAKNINNMGSKTVINIPNIIGKGEHNHPTEKPVDLMKLLVSNSTNEGDIVIDPFCGTGNLCVACKQLKRKYIGIDIDKKYIDISKERLDNTLKPLF